MEPPDGYVALADVARLLLQRPARYIVIQVPADVERGEAEEELPADYSGWVEPLELPRPLPGPPGAAWEVGLLDELATEGSEMRLPDFELGGSHHAGRGAAFASSEEHQRRSASSGAVGAGPLPACLNSGRRRLDAIAWQRLCGRRGASSPPPDAAGLPKGAAAPRPRARRAVPPRGPPRPRQAKARRCASIGAAPGVVVGCVALTGALMACWGAVPYELEIHVAEQGAKDVLHDVMRAGLGSEFAPAAGGQGQGGLLPDRAQNEGGAARPARDWPSGTVPLQRPRELATGGSVAGGAAEPQHEGSKRITVEDLVDSLLDRNGDHVVTFMEMRRWAIKFYSMPPAETARAFRRFDRDRSGAWSVEEGLAFLEAVQAG